MLDRESTFALPETVQLLQSQFVPVAIDQAYQRRQKDTEGEFYRTIAKQSPRSDMRNTTQGFYVASPSGKLLFYNNNRDPQKLLRLLKESLKEFQALPEEERSSLAIEETKVDARYQPEPPTNGLVVRVRAKVLGGYEPTDNPWQQIFQAAVSRDNLWITAEEKAALSEGQIPKLLQLRIAKFHLVDNTRGEPPMWQDSEIRELEMKLDQGVLTGVVHLQTKDGKRGFEAKIRGVLETRNGEVSNLQFVALGEFWGEGPYTRNAPQGRFPLAVGFTLADGSDVADAIPPQGSRGWVQGYLE